jgi:hypothetical protein
LKKYLPYFLISLSSCYNLEYVGAGRNKYEIDEAYWQPGESFGNTSKRPESSDDFFSTAKPVIPYDHRTYYDYNLYNRPYVYQPYQPVLVVPKPTYQIVKPYPIKPFNSRGGGTGQTRQITHLKRP